MKHSWYIILICILFSSATQAQIGAKAQSPKIHGTWINHDFGYEMKLVLGTNGQGEFDGDAITFAVQSSTLTITLEGVKTIYNYALQGNSMVLSGGDIERPIAFTRQGAENETLQANKGGDINSQLAGLWSGYNETIEFTSDGRCKYQGQTYPFSADAKQITFETTQGKFIMAYTLNANNLNLVVNGQSLDYTRGKAKVSGGNTNSTGGKSMDQTLVGKWCYVNVTTTNSGGTSSDECITINADGSYVYYSERSMSANTPSLSAGTSSQSSDRGTWWVEGDRVHYSSQTQGATSYQLQKRNHPKTGDAMIVLDGRTYVTYYNRSPW